MLNETWRLWQALLNLEIEVPKQHPLIQPLPSSEKRLLRVRLDAGGNVTAVEDVAEDERYGLWRIVKTSDGSFPVVKVNQPILDLPQGHPLISATSKEKRLKALTTVQKECSRRTADAIGHDWGNSLNKAKLLAQLQDDSKATGIGVLAQRFEAAISDGARMPRQLADVCISAVAQGRLSGETTVCELLIGKGFDRGKPRKISVLLVLDLANEASVYGRAARERVAEILPTNLAVRERTHEHVAAGSAFGGDG